MSHRAHEPPSWTPCALTPPPPFSACCSLFFNTLQLTAEGFRRGPLCRRRGECELCLQRCACCHFRNALGLGQAMAAAAVMRTPDRASAISYSALPALSTRVVVRGKGNNFIGQRPLLKRAVTARASQQLDRNGECQLSDAPSALGTFAAALTPYVAVFASALVAASPAAATLAPGEILQLQETLTEVWGKL